jgi:cytoskeletal protein CcmA (bactofilin family)
MKEKTQRANLLKIETLLGKNTVINGDLHFGDGLQLDGIIRGNVTADDSSNAVFVIGENGRVEGEIRVANVVVRGQVVGPIYANKTVELTSTSAVLGDIFYNQIEIAMGAKISGKMVCMIEKPISGELIHDTSVQPVESKVNKEEVVEEVVA